MLNKIRQQLNKIHNFYLKKFKFYRTWHEQPNSKKIHKVTLALFALFALLSALYVMPFSPFRAKAAGNYYVDNKAGANCSDTGPGSSSQPWCTIQKAADMVSAGDTVMVSSGTYSEPNVTVNKAINIVKNNDTKPIVQHGFTITAAATLDGFEIGGVDIGSGSAAINITASNAIVKNSYIHDIFPAPDGSRINFYEGIRVTGNVSGVIIEGNTITRTGHDGINVGGSLSLGSTTSATVRNNTLSYNGYLESQPILPASIARGFVATNDTWGVNITVYGTNSTIEHNNLSWGWQGTMNIVGKSNLIHGNTMYLPGYPYPEDTRGRNAAGQLHHQHIYEYPPAWNNVYDGNLFGKSDGAHWEFDNQYFGPQSDGNSPRLAYVTNNVFLEQEYLGGIMLYDGSSTTGSMDIYIYNNTFLSSAMYLSGDPNNWNDGSVRVFNNIFAGEESINEYEATDHAKFNHDYNLYINSGAHPLYGSLASHEITGDPLLSPEYRPDSASPAVNTGVQDANTPTTDKDGNARVGAPDIGAYEYQPKYYVSPTGSALWSSCSNISTPCSMTTALASYSPGDTIYLRGGSYSQRYSFTRSGESNKKVYFASYNNESVNLAQGLVVSGSHLDFTGIRIEGGATLGSNDGQLQITGSNNNFKDLTIFSNATGNSIRFQSGSNNMVDGIDISNSGGIYVAPTSSYITVKNGTIHHTSGGIATITGDYTTFDHLDIHDPGQTDFVNGNAADGFNINGNHITISNNRIYNIFKQVESQHIDAIQWWNNANDLTVTGNTFGSTATGGTLNIVGAGHLMIEAQTGKTCHRVKITNNVFVASSRAYFLDVNTGGDWTTGLVADDWVIANNVFRGGSNAFRGGNFFSNMRRATVENNIFYKSGGVSTMAAGGLWTNNAYVNTAIDPISTNHLVTTNPMFVDGDPTVSNGYGQFGNYHLLEGSPVIDAGILNQFTPTTDKDGNPRVGAPDIGAYEYDSSGGGGSCTASNGDINGDTHVNISDAAILMAKWNQNVTNDPADVNCSGKVDISDAAILMSRWGT